MKLGVSLSPAYIFLQSGTLQEMSVCLFKPNPVRPKLADGHSSYNLEPLTSKHSPACLSNCP